MLRVLIALLMFPSVSSAQVKGSIGTSIVRPGLPAPAPSLTATPLPLLASPSLISPSLIMGSAVSAPAAAVQAVPVALSAKAAAPAALPVAPVMAAAAAAAQPSAPVEASKSEAGALFDGPLKVLIAGSEAVPFIKTGGLADVVDALSRGLAARGHDVTMVLPKYRALNTAGVALEKAGTVSIPVGGRMETANLLVGRRDGVRVVLLEHPEYYEREGGPYAAKHAALGLSAYDAAGIDDADERFGFYSRAALEAMRVLDVRPDIISAHDWHAALIPAYLKTVYKNDPFFAGTKATLTIHNIAFQGAFALATAGKLGFDAADLDHKGGANYLKAGIERADAVTTVSPTYAKEIVENILFGMGLEGPLRARPDGVHGIINGIDPVLYDPAADPDVVRHYGIDDAAAGKAANKAALQRKLGLEEKPDAPLFLVASRLAHQKGIDMIFDSARDVVRLGGQLLIMGAGDAQTEALRAALVAAFPGKIASYPFDEKFVRMGFAAADFLLMPSRFEPCGLSQLIAQRYGALPLVTSVGGLADTVRDLRDDPVHGDGLIIRAVASISLSRAIADAVKGYRNPEAFALARRSAMSKDSSWEVSLDVYEALFRRLLRPEGPGNR